MNRPITSQRVASASEWRALSLRCAPERRDAFLRGEIPAYDDVHGHKRILPPGAIVTVALDPAAAVAKSDPAKPTTTSTIAPVTTAAPERPRADVSDLIARFKKAGEVRPDGFDVEKYLRESEAKRSPTVEPPRAKHALNDVSDLLQRLVNA